MHAKDTYSNIRLVEPPYAVDAALKNKQTKKSEANITK